MISKIDCIQQLSCISGCRTHRCHSCAYYGTATKDKHLAKYWCPLLCLKKRTGHISNRHDHLFTILQKHFRFSLGIIILGPLFFSRYWHITFSLVSIMSCFQKMCPTTKNPSKTQPFVKDPLWILLSPNSLLLTPIGIIYVSIVPYTLVFLPVDCGKP